METLQFDLITPEKIFFSDAAHQIDIPGTEGEFGVLPGHAPFISSLRPGVLKIFTGKDSAKRVFVGGGIAEVNEKSCSVLAERVIELDGLARADAEKALEKAKAKLEKTFDEPAKTIAERDVEIAKEVLAVL